MEMEWSKCNYSRDWTDGGQANGYLRSLTRAHGQALIEMDGSPICDCETCLVTIYQSDLEKKTVLTNRVDSFTYSGFLSTCPFICVV